MPSRIIREGIIHSPRINALSMGAELFYRRLMSVADDYGRYHGSIPTLRASCWPTNPETIREKDISKWLNELLKGEEPLVRAYFFGGFSYIEIQNFGQQIRAKSKFPEPPWHKGQQDTENSAKQMQSGCEANAKPSRSRISDADAKAEEPPNPQRAPDGALALVTPKSSPSKRGRRTTEQIRKSLGAERLSWWENFWRVYPCHEGINPAMDAFERIVTTHELAVEVYRGAQRYAIKIHADPTARVKYAQGWLNAERWKDEIDARASPAADPVTALALKNLERTGRIFG